MKAKHTDLVIAASGQVSNAISMKFVKSLVIHAPAALSGTVSVEVSPVVGGAAADFRTLQTGGSDVTIAADKAVAIIDVAFAELRLASTLAEAAERTFAVTYVEEA